MNKSHQWQFKTRFRKRAYGWRGTALASKRLKEAVSEIKKVNKIDSVLAAVGAISLMERIWPALEHIDTSSGSLGNAIRKTLDELIPLLIKAKADKITRKIWMERLYEAVVEDGVDYLNPVQERWGEICGFDDLVNEWADTLISTLKQCWEKGQPGGYFIGTDICLSCLLAAGRYEELEQVLSLRKVPFWPYDKFQAEGLRRQGRIEEAIAFAESRLKNGYGEQEIVSFCEDALIQEGRKEEAYKRYGLSVRQGMTYLTQFRSIVKTRQILLNLIEQSGDKGVWFASARQAGYFDIAIDCAYSGYVDPKTLIRAARDTVESESRFSAGIALRAVELLLQGKGYEVSVLDVYGALKHLRAAAEKLDAKSWAVGELKSMLNRNMETCNSSFREIVLKELSGM